jgi:hypothetical protein
MLNKIEHIKDVNGQNYLAIKIDNTELTPFMDKLKLLLGNDMFNLYTGNQKTRDKGEHHITVINVMDYGRLTKEMGIDKFVDALQPVLEYDIDDIDMIGIGKAEAKGNTAYFVVCESDKLDAVRTRFNLSKQDFHVTIGFDKKDVFGVSKDRSSLID